MSNKQNEKQTAIKGFADLFGADSRAFTLLEAKAREIFGHYAYEELRTPVLERTELFCRSIGTETDVVQKEMYTFADRKDRSLTMRPEATAGVVRAYIESGRAKNEAISKFFTFGPMFRYERPQKGRMRQFHQINCECFGSKEPVTDAETIAMLMNFLHEVGITDAELQINSLGCAECRPTYRATLYDYLKSLEPSALCEDCKRRMELNPLRVLDCKVPTCIKYTECAPHILDSNCPDCRNHFYKVIDFLSLANIGHKLNHRLVRGLDYYCRTTFEVVSGAIGAQSSIAGGGRYDGLVHTLGGPDMPGIGFACGMERLAMLLPEAEAQIPNFFIATMDAAKNADILRYAFELADKMRKCGLSGEIGTGGFKGQMRQANKTKAKFCLILGPDEIAQKHVAIKNMNNGEQVQFSLKDIGPILQFLA